MSGGYRGLHAAMPLENWRLPFYRIAADFEKAEGSPSRMFWDEIDSATLFDPSLWSSCSRDSGNYWRFEPNIAGELHYTSGSRPYELHTDLFHEARFRSITVRQMVDVDTRYDDDPFYPAHSDRFARGVVEEALLQANWKYGFFRIGRQKRNWGPFPDRSLLLSSNPYAYDAIEWQIAGGILEYRHLFAPFTWRSSRRDVDGGGSIGRYLTAHSLNIILGKWVTIGLSETVLFTRSEGFPDLQYINPFSLYSVVNMNQEGNGNLMLGLQWNIHPFTDAVSLRGQLVLDDFQVDDDKVTDQEPTHWGIDAGIYWHNPVRISATETLLKFEAAYLSEWLYTVPDRNAEIGERYSYGGKSLGYSFNDGISLRLEGVAVINNYGAAHIAITYNERGGNTELSRWNDKTHISGLPFSEQRPAEQRFAVGVGGVYYFKDLMGCSLYAEPGWLKNKDNLATGSWKFDPRVSMELSLHYSNLFVRLP